MRILTMMRLVPIAAALVAAIVPTAIARQPAAAQVAPSAQLRRIYGVLVGVDLVTQTASFQKRNGKVIVLDISQAESLQQIGVLPLNKPVAIWGVRGTDKLFHVQSIGHTAPTQSHWGDDTDTGQ